jgi:two-component system, chemotaxis family, CheB/CheR fusion protein
VRTEDEPGNVQKKRPRRAPRRDELPPIVGIGASAGGVSALQELVERIPKDSGIAWVLILHMAPDRDSDLAGILGRKTSLPVFQVVTDTAIEPDHVYVISPGRVMTLADGKLHPVADHDPVARRTSIDAFLISLAEAQGEHAGCALLSGAGTDGTLGLKAVKEAGGLTLTQTLQSAQYDSMLLSALRTGLVDREADIADMPELFADFLVRRRPIVREVQLGDGERFRISEILREAVGHDFSGYKSGTMDRRIRRRMQLRGLTSLAEYLELVETDPLEPSRLFRDLLIGVTQFFRDPDAFIALSKRELARILEGKTEEDKVRIWVPGCSTGEEVYSLAMLLFEQAEALESPPDIKIFGSDIDENALHVGRLGRYPHGIVADVTPERLARFFDREDGTYVVRPRLRELCLFAQHNLLRDPPFSRVDLISCRNVLIYMDTPLQKRLMPVFHYALRPNGILFLGPAENPGPDQKLFAELDRKHRIFRRIGETSRLPDFPIGAGDGKKAGRRSDGDSPNGTRDAVQRSAQRLLERYSPAYVIVDSGFDILEASSGTGEFLELPKGRPNANLSAMARSDLAVDIKAAVSHVFATGEKLVRSDLVVGSEQNRRGLTLVVEPLPGADAGQRLCLVVFQTGARLAPVAEGRRRQGGDDQFIRVLEHELKTTKERLQSTLEELETSNEELMASNEELSSVNEELQSSNEELETSKEELQSINEELRTVNNELNARVEELSRANSDLKNLFGNTRIAMLFLDREYRVHNFTPPAKPLFRLRDHDLGRPLDELAGRIDFEPLKAQVAEVIRTGEQIEHEVEARNGDRQTLIMRMLPYHDENDQIEGAVLTFVDITERKRQEEELASIVSELNHRVKNSLASVQAMVRQSGARAETKEELLDILMGQLQAMSTAHGILSSAEWKGAAFEDLARAVLAPFAGPDSLRLEVRGPHVELKPEAVVSLGLILQELATNAAKYGAWSNEIGRVSLSWELDYPSGKTLQIEWREGGGPPVEPPDRLGFGLNFIVRCAEYELKGTCVPEFPPEGLLCRFSIPAGEALRDRPASR